MEEVCCKKEKNNKKDCSCLWLIVGIVAAVLSFFIGVLVSAFTGIITTLGENVIIALVIIMAVLLVVAIISIICCKKCNNRKMIY